jgi:hypothetical protein
LHISDLINAAAGHIDDPPAARWMAVAVELEGGYVVFCTYSTGNSQTLAGLHILDLIDVVAFIAQRPTARRMVVAVELERLNVVFSAHASCNSEALAGSHVYQHELVGDRGSGGRSK